MRITCHMILPMQNSVITKLLTGQKQMQERWKRMTNMVDQQLGDNLGQIYVQKYFTAADKERISQLVDNITGQPLQKESSSSTG